MEGRTVHVTSGTPYDGFFQQYIFVSNNNVKAVIEADNGTVEMVDLADFYFTDSPAASKPSRDEVFDFRLAQFLGEVFCVVQLGDMRIFAGRRTQSDGTIQWRELTIPS